jgi:hypothetical protein
LIDAMIVGSQAHWPCLLCTNIAPTWHQYYTNMAPTEL